MNLYCDLKKICPELDSLNIGGGFPIKNSLSFDYDYEYMAEEIVAQIKNICDREGVKEPDIFTEFGSFTVGEASAALFSVLQQKRQNDRELWNMIDSSFMTTLPDTWAINQQFIILAINNWDKAYERVFTGRSHLRQSRLLQLRVSPECRLPPANRLRQLPYRRHSR